MKTIVNKLNIDQSDVLPAFNLNLRLEKYDVMGCLEERKYSSPIKKCVESTRIGSTTEKTPNSKSFHRFFEAMEKLKNDMKGLSEISLVKEKVNRIGLKHVKSDKILKL